MGRQPCCDKQGVKKGPWTAEEDKKLINFILTNGHCCWRMLPKLAGLCRCGKSCRLRWTNYLRPDLKRGLLTESEEQLVIELHARLGNRWSKIAAKLPGRTDNEIKNHWNTHIKKKLLKMGIDPVTHKPLCRESNTERAHSTHREVPVEAHQTKFGDCTSQPDDCTQYSNNSSADLPSCLWEEYVPLTDASWKFPCNDVNLFPLDASCDWLTDYQDLGLVAMESIGSNKLESIGSNKSQ